MATFSDTQPSPDFDGLAQRLAPHYQGFRVSERLLMTGHSHQAWPDVAREGVLEAFDVAARDVDAKWGEAFARTEVLRGWLREAYNDPSGRYTLAPNTHDLVVRWLSALDLRAKPRVVISDGEFHSIARQMARLEEEGLEVVRVAALPLDGFAQRVAEAVNAETAAVCVSRVLFETSLVHDDLGAVAEVCEVAGVPLLIDDYHGTNVVPLDLRAAGLEGAFVLIGGYKYLQWGEGNCFLRFPASCALRPVLTGWFASFATLDAPRVPGARVHFADDDQRFAGATYDPTSQFRAARVVAFYREQGLTQAVLRAHAQAQVGYLRERFEALGLPEARLALAHREPIERNGGFLALRGPQARAICAALKARGVLTDARGAILRFGPAPYTTKAQLDAAMRCLAECVDAVEKGAD